MVIFCIIFVTFQCERFILLFPLFGVLAGENTFTSSLFTLSFCCNHHCRNIIPFSSWMLCTIFGNKVHRLLWFCALQRTFVCIAVYSSFYDSWIHQRISPNESYLVTNNIRDITIHLMNNMY